MLLDPRIEISIAIMAASIYWLWLRKWRVFEDDGFERYDEMKQR